MSRRLPPKVLPIGNLPSTGLTGRRKSVRLGHGYFAAIRAAIALCGPEQRIDRSPRATPAPRRIRRQTT